MKNLSAVCLFVICMFILQACGPANSGKFKALHKELSAYISNKDATIGVALIINGTDTVEVNGRREFPMLSVYKFPIALTLAESYREKGLKLETPIRIYPDDLHLDTYSPMTEKLLASSRIETDSLTIPTHALLTYMLQQSDNNASDIALRLVGRAQNVGRYLSDIGAEGITVNNSESEMHDNTSLCYDNSATPIAMASLLDDFDRNYNDPLSVEIKSIMETCSTGTDRLAKPLTQANATIGHKTGTGFTLPDGRLMAVNDAGYVHLPDGRRYSIAVFIEDSGYDMAATESIIADISEIVLSSIAKDYTNISGSGK